ncbi:MAG: UvrB/UvrC motif-containing protein [candidate division KSB1 bacterium]|nr:UvrB/UvrC motif-containing protein [candidate division KSB1 bacterium]
MIAAAEKLEFEKAAAIRDEIERLKAGKKSGGGSKYAKYMRGGYDE